MKLRAILVTALALMMLTACQHARQVLPTGEVDILSNDLTITPNFQARTISGSQITTFTTGKAGKAEISFSPNELVIKRATIDGQVARFAISARSIVFAAEKLVQPNQIVKLEVTYSASPNRGFSFTETGILTTYFACDWMLCRQDMPNDKSTLALNLVLSSGMQALSVGQDRFVETLSVGHVRHRWRSHTAFSSYLFGFAAGQFETQVIRHAGRELAYVNATGQAQPMARLFGTTPAMVDFFAAKAGMPLPASRYTQILVTGSNAQEHATYSVIGTSTINPILTDPTEDWVIAHELAHQWWGNSVTSASWQHFWLNEGMTVFMTAAWKEHRHGRAVYDREMNVARARWTRAKDAGWDRPLAFAGEYPSLGTRRAIQYSKGALFMDHLRTILGEDVFWRGIRDYTRANAGKAVVSKDFQGVMERASGRDLRETFDEWVYATVS